MPNGTTTISGIVLMLAPIVANLFGYDTSPSFEGDASELLAAAITIVGSIVALYGRAKAKGPLFVKRS